MTSVSKTIRRKVLKYFLDNPNNAISIEELAKEVVLKPRQVERAVQHFMDKNILVGAKHPYPQFGKVGAKPNIYALSDDVHRKVSKNRLKKV